MKINKIIYIVAAMIFITSTANTAPIEQGAPNSNTDGTRSDTTIDQDQILRDKIKDKFPNYSLRKQNRIFEKIKADPEMEDILLGSSDNDSDDTTSTSSDSTPSITESTYIADSEESEDLSSSESSDTAPSQIVFPDRKLPIPETLEEPVSEFSSYPPSQTKSTEDTESWTGDISQFGKIRVTTPSQTKSTEEKTPIPEPFGDFSYITPPQTDSSYRELKISKKKNKKGKKGKKARRSYKNDFSDSGSNLYDKPCLIKNTSDSKAFNPIDSSSYAPSYASSPEIDLLSKETQSIKEETAREAEETQRMREENARSAEEIRVTREEIAREAEETQRMREENARLLEEIRKNKEEISQLLERTRRLEQERHISDTTSQKHSYILDASNHDFFLEQCRKMEVNIKEDINQGIIPQISIINSSNFSEDKKYPKRILENLKISAEINIQEQ
ncbi:MAG: hypothetical protein LBI26_02165 [Holosporales bacterium]|jgi:colicin import membrane protein|nr:hypothetical protein [Holosporales bacterium]